MPSTLTCYGGVGEIGGNKFLIRDKDTRIILDFGTGFEDGSDFFDSGIEPRKVNGAGDLFEFGILPEIPGLYSKRALQNTRLAYGEPEVQAVVVSHFHSDHVGRIEHLDERIPVHCGEATSLLSEAARTSGGSPLDGHQVRTFRTGGKFNVSGVEFVPVHVDHSIPGAYGFVIHTSEGTLAYTGDFRFHGPMGKMTSDFVSAASGARPDVLLTEGTRVSPRRETQGMTEESVLRHAKKLVAESDKLVLSTFRGNDVDRINTFNEASLAAGRQLVVSMKAAVVLEKLSTDTRLKVPKVGKDVLVYVRRKKTGSIDDRDYNKWERAFLGSGITAGEVRRRQREVFLHLDAWNFPEVIDIKPDRGGTYIHAATEAFNEEGEREDKVVRNWVRHVGFTYNQLHSSGHASSAGVKRMVQEVRARRTVPVHTEHPAIFRKLVAKNSGSEVHLPSKAVPISIS